MISGYHNSAAKKDIVRFVLKLHNYDADRNALGYLVCDINSAALTSIMAKYVDVEQVCLWLQPLNDRVIAMTGGGFRESVQNPETACKGCTKSL